MQVVQANDEQQRWRQGAKQRRFAVRPTASEKME
jgi:hypothetical protein